LVWPPPIDESCCQLAFAPGHGATGPTTQSTR
jgi:hypothetical protein